MNSSNKIPLWEEQFLEFLILKKYADKTRKSVVRTFRYFLNWAETENIETINTRYADILAYMEYCKKKGNKQITIQQTINCIKHYYDFLIDRQEITDNPCAGVDVKGVKRRILQELFTTEELQSIYDTYCSMKPHINGIGSKLSHKRNKVMLGLLIFQGIKVEEMAKLKVEDVKLREGKLYLIGGRKSQEREMTLESHQIFDLMDYINETRKLILMLSEKQTNALFVSLGGSEHFSNLLDKLLKHLKAQNKKLKNLQQIRASVITNWLNVHGLRKVQHLAGHRYVSSTESYKVNNMEDLKADVNRYHPDF